MAVLSDGQPRPCNDGCEERWDLAVALKCVHRVRSVQEKALTGAETYRPATRSLVTVASSVYTDRCLEPSRTHRRGADFAPRIRPSCFRPSPSCGDRVGAGICSPLRMGCAAFRPPLATAQDRLSTFPCSATAQSLRSADGIRGDRPELGDLGPRCRRAKAACLVY